MFACQIKSSKKRRHSPPKYTREELKEWVFSQEKFHELYANWVKSGNLKELVPSVDRINDYKGYSFDNIRLVTWAENLQSLHEDRVNGVNNKTNISVKQYSLEGEFIQEFHSRNQAERVTGVSSTSISACTKGKLQTSGGFLWRNS